MWPLGSNAVDPDVVRGVDVPPLQSSCRLHDVQRWGGGGRGLWIYGARLKSREQFPFSSLRSEGVAAFHDLLRVASAVGGVRPQLNRRRPTEGE